MSGNSCDGTTHTLKSKSANLPTSLLYLCYTSNSLHLTLPAYLFSHSSFIEMLQILSTYIRDKKAVVSVNLQTGKKNNAPLILSCCTGVNWLAFRRTYKFRLASSQIFEGLNNAEVNEYFFQK